MKLNWTERAVVNNPLRALEQRVEVHWLKKRLPALKGASVLEVGCGRGAGASLISDSFGPMGLHAMDLDPRMLRAAKRYLRARGKGGLPLYAADLCMLPHGDGIFDAVFCFGVLHHIPDWQSALKEISRILKRGGLYVFEEIYPPFYQNLVTRRILLHPTTNRFRSRELKKGLREARLSLVDALEVERFWILGISRKEG